METALLGWLYPEERSAVILRSIFSQRSILSIYMESLNWQNFRFHNKSANKKWTFVEKIVLLERNAFCCAGWMVRVSCRQRYRADKTDFHFSKQEGASHVFCVYVVHPLIWTVECCSLIAEESVQMGECRFHLHLPRCVVRNLGNNVPELEAQVHVKSLFRICQM